MAAEERLYSKEIDRLIMRFTVVAAAAAAQGITGVEAEAVGPQLSLLVLIVPAQVEGLALLLEEVAVAVAVFRLAEAGVQAEVMEVQVQVVAMGILNISITSLLVAVVAVLQSLATPTLHG